MSRKQRKGGRKKRRTGPGTLCGDLDNRGNRYRNYENLVFYLHDPVDELKTTPKLQKVCLCLQRRPGTRPSQQEGSQIANALREMVITNRS